MLMGLIIVSKHHTAGRVEHQPPTKKKIGDGTTGRAVGRQDGASRGRRLGAC